MRAAPVLALALGSALAWPDARGFSNIAPGEHLRDREMPALAGGAAPLLGKGRVSVFVFFRGGHDRSLEALRQLAELEREFAGRGVRFVAVVSAAEPRDAVVATVRDAGIVMPVLLDRGDELYGELGVALHPVVGIADERHRLAAYQHYLKVNMLDAVRARIQRVLGEITDAQLEAVLRPPPPPRHEALVAGRRAALARELLARGQVAKALDNARAAVAADPTAPAAQSVLAEALAAAGRCAEAETARAEAVRLDPRRAKERAPRCGR